MPLSKCKSETFTDFVEMLYLIIIILRPKVKTGIAKRKAELKCMVASDDKDLSPKEIRQKNRIIHVSSEFIIVFF